MITDNIIPEGNLVNNTEIIFNKARDIFDKSKAKSGVIVRLYENHPELPSASECYLKKQGFGNKIHFLGTKKFGEIYRSYFLCLNIKANKVVYTNIELVDYLDRNMQDLQTVYLEKSLINTLKKFYGKDCKLLFLGSYSTTVSVVINDENVFNLNRLNNLSFVVRPLVELSDKLLTCLLNTSGIVGLCRI